MEQKDKPKQTNWLIITIVSTMFAGVVQVIVNHFDSIAAFLGGSLTHVHLSVVVAGMLNTISAFVTIGGAIASPFVYKYVKRTRRMEVMLKKIRKITEETLVIIDEPMPIQPLINREESWRQLEEAARANSMEITEKPKN